MDTASVGCVLLALAEMAWLVAARAVHLFTRPARVAPPPAVTMALRDEPPAVVNLITNRWTITDEVVPAVIVDLAARGVLVLQPTGERYDRLVVRSMRGKVPGLTSYEVAVLDHLRRIAQNGVVPATLMASTPSSEDASWWRHVRRAIIRDARRRGLTRARYPTQLVVVMGAVLIAFAFALLGLLLAADTGDPLTAKGATAPWTVAAAIVGLAVCFLVARETDLDAQRQTRVGLAVAQEWLGVREGLVRSGELRRPSAVYDHGRAVAYATAMGVAPSIAGALPLGAVDDEQAWSDATGAWRAVSVHYPRWRPAWGERPERAIAIGAAWTATLLLPFLVYRHFGNGLPAHLAQRMHDMGAGNEGNSDPFLSDTAVRFVAAVISTVAGAVMTVVTVNAFYRGVVPFVCGLADLGPARAVRGRLVRSRRHLRQAGDSVAAHPTVAVDNGRHDDLVARRVRARFANAVAEGDLVELRVTPRLGFVSSLRRLDEA